MCKSVIYLYFYIIHRTRALYIKATAKTRVYCPAERCYQQRSQLRPTRHQFITAEGGFLPLPFYCRVRMYLHKGKGVAKLSHDDGVKSAL